jgi:hypothetical protein
MHLKVERSSLPLTDELEVLLGGRRLIWVPLIR